jgi:hypothetical protein
MTSYLAAFLAKTKLENVRVGNFIPSPWGATEK